MSDDVTADLTLRAAQAQVDASIQALGGYWPPLANLARLFEECGEVARVVNQTHGPKRRKADEHPPELAEELGDTLYVLLVLANSLDVDLAAALHTVLTKYEQRDGARRARNRITEAMEDEDGTRDDAR